MMKHKIHMLSYVAAMILLMTCSIAGCASGNHEQTDSTDGTASEVLDYQAYTEIISALAETSEAPSWEVFCADSPDLTAALLRNPEEAAYYACLDLLTGRVLEEPRTVPPGTLQVENLVLAKLLEELGETPYPPYESPDSVTWLRPVCTRVMEHYHSNGYDYTADAYEAVPGERACLRAILNIPSARIACTEVQGDDVDAQLLIDGSAVIAASIEQGTLQPGVEMVGDGWDGALCSSELCSETVKWTFTQETADTVSLTVMLGNGASVHFTYSAPEENRVD